MMGGFWRKQRKVFISVAVSVSVSTEIKVRLKVGRKSNESNWNIRFIN